MYRWKKDFIAVSKEVLLMSYVNILELEKKRDKRIVLLPKPYTNISIREDTVLSLR